MRIATSQIYTASLKNMNTALNDVMELRTMSTTQKKINSPSDDPSGTALCMQLTAYDAELSSYQENCTLAASYLATADSSLQQSSEIITSIKELAEQASTDTYSQVQLEAMGVELRELMDSLFQMSNAKLGENYLFSGNDIENSAYEQQLGVTIDDPSMTAASIASVTGDAPSTVYVQATSSGVVGTDAITYRYSTDGGDTWEEATLAADASVLECGDCAIALEDGTALTAETGTGDGTNLYVRPAYAYMGSDEAMQVATGESTVLETTTVGASIFGGIDPSTGDPYSGANLFEITGDLIAYMETGNSDGVASCLEDLTAAYEKLLQTDSNIGARQINAQNIESAIAITRDRNTSQISSVENADATQLTIEMAQAEYVYQSVLATTTTVFSLNLLEYL